MNTNVGLIQSLRPPKNLEGLNLLLALQFSRKPPTIVASLCYKCFTVQVYLYVKLHESTLSRAPELINTTVTPTLAANLPQ